MNIHHTGLNKNVLGVFSLTAPIFRAEFIPKKSRAAKSQIQVTSKAILVPRPGVLCRCDL
jgi:hypothetical protein